MPRQLRACPIGIPQHIIQRGNNRQVCFVTPKDFAVYAQWLHEAARIYGVKIHAWVFMTNHVHLLGTPEAEDGISPMMQHLGRRYVRYFNSHYRRSFILTPFSHPFFSFFAFEFVTLVNLGYIHFC
jgi:putative transposase